jgi:peptidoglycan/xylan/chitin deacetylase (PgdA/CDA1 family)
MRRWTRPLLLASLLSGCATAPARAPLDSLPAYYRAQLNELQRRVEESEVEVDHATAEQRAAHDLLSHAVAHHQWSNLPYARELVRLREAELQMARDSLDVERTRLASTWSAASQHHALGDQQWEAQSQRDAARLQRAREQVSARRAEVERLERNLLATDRGASTSLDRRHRRIGG